MKHLLTFVALVFYISSFAQTKQVLGKVLNLTTKKPIMYTNIWVQNQNTGTTSDENGHFMLENLADTSVLVFSALSYETQIIKVKDLRKEIKLKPIAIQLKTVTISPPKLKKAYKTGKVKKSKVSVWYCSGKQPFRFGKVFPNSKKYKKTPFLKTVEFVAEAEKTNRKVLLHIYEVGKGNPENWNILAQNIECDVQKGEKITKVNLAELQIKMPKTGIMVIIEWLIIDSNYYTYEILDSRTKKKMMLQHFEPCVGTVPAETNENTWVYKGKWIKQFRQSDFSPKKYKNKYTELAMELILSD